MNWPWVRNLVMQSNFNPGCAFIYTLLNQICVREIFVFLEQHSGFIYHVLFFFNGVFHLPWCRLPFPCKPENSAVEAKNFLSCCCCHLGLKVSTWSGPATSSQTTLALVLSAPSHLAFSRFLPLNPSRWIFSPPRKLIPQLPPFLGSPPNLASSEQPYLI